MPDSTVVGTIQRVIVEAPGFGQEHPGDDHDHRHHMGESREEVYLVTAEGDAIEVPLRMAAGLETGDRARARVSATSGDSIRTLTLQEQARPIPRSGRSGVQQLPYALVSVTTPDTTGVPATEADMRRWLLDATQSFFDREAAGAFEFSVHSSHQLTLDESICRNEFEAVAQVRERLSIPKDVGVIVLGLNDTCGYAGLAVLGRAQPGLWITMNYASPASMPAWSRDFYEAQGREVTIHEMGHNLGLRHSRRWQCPTGLSPFGEVEVTCDLYEYGSESSVMGAGPEQAALDAHERWQLGVYGPGRMLSAEAGSGTAILLLDRQPYAGSDNGQPSEWDGRRLVRAVQLREGEGEVWLTARDPLIVGWGDVSLPAGVVALHRTERLRGNGWSSTSPVQLDIVPGVDPATASPEEWLASRFDVALPGTTFTTPGGTRVSVGAAVTTSAGRGFPITWQGADRPSQAPGVPQVWSQDEWEWMSGVAPWVKPGELSVLLPEAPPDMATCSIIDDSDRVVAAWDTQELLPAPSPLWWSDWTAVATALGETFDASWRYPLTGNLIDGDLEGQTEVAEGVTQWRSTCTDFLGRVTTSESATTVRVDGTPPVVAQGELALIGFEPRAFAATDSVPVRVRLPGFADTASGLSERTGSCDLKSPSEPVECIEPVEAGTGRVSSGASDMVGNVSETVSLRYEIKAVNPVRKSTRQWFVYNRYGAIPRSKGASATVTVQGRSAGVIAQCGAGTGRLEVRVNAAKPVLVNLAKGPSQTCMAAVVSLPPGKARLTVTYRGVGELDSLIRVVTLQ